MGGWHQPEVIEDLNSMLKAPLTDREVAQVAGDVCSGPPYSPVVVVAAWDKHTDSTDAEAVELINDIAVLGRPARASEDTDPNRRIVMALGRGIGTFIFYPAYGTTYWTLCGKGASSAWTRSGQLHDLNRL